MPDPSLRIFQTLSDELQVRPAQVVATVGLLDDGASVPFIARYRKEATGGLDDTELRQLAERLTYLRELESRRQTVVSSIAEQGKLTTELAAAIDGCTSKQQLEDLYLPYKPKRRTKAQIAREAGLEPLALLLLAEPDTHPELAAADYLNADAGFADVKAVLDGARQILMERFAEDAELLSRLRSYLHEHALIRSQVVEGKEREGEKFRDWFDFAEPWRDAPSHRVLALLRGRNEGFLHVGVVLPETLTAEASADPRCLNPCEKAIAARFAVKEGTRAADRWLIETVRWAWRVKLQLSLELELLSDIKARADQEAIAVFARNLKNLLLAAPAGRRVTMGLDPGIRTGVKVAVVDAQGKLLETATVYPHEPRRDWQGSLTTLAALCRRHRVELIAIGNGTASRETDQLASELIASVREFRLDKMVVSEAGASVYSASAFAANEFPELDVSLRGAVSIARRLQDPLAELVKIDPKAIGVGQYQHDISPSALAKSLDAVVEDCVNAVGVDVNTASVPLLTSVSGLNSSLAAAIVAYRDNHGPFPNRRALCDVPRLGEKTFEQAAGFLRINGGDDPLDASAVHPEAYPVVERILARLGKPIGEVMGNEASLRQLNVADYVSERFGLPTVRDIVRELEKPGRDPRPSFKTARFAEGVSRVADLRPGMQLEGVVTNVANFGAFIDVGVHQDGLAHVSALAERFVKDPGEVVKVGDIVKVKVLQVDVARSRIALTLRLNDPLPSAEIGPEAQTPLARPRQSLAPRPRAETAPAAAGALAEAFARLRR